MKKTKKIPAFIVSAVMCTGLVTPVAPVGAETEASVIESIDFESYTDETTLITGDINGLGGKLTFINAAATGNSVEVTTDPVTGSKALKLTKGDDSEDSDSLELNYLLNNRITKGDYKISYDVRIAQAGAAYPKLGILHTGNSWEVLNYLQMYSGGGLYGGNFSDWKATYVDWFSTNNVKYNYVMNIDGENNICDVKMDIDGIDTSTTYGIADYTSKSFGGFNFVLTKGSVSGNNKGWETGDGVMYIDNIVIEEIKPVVVIPEEPEEGLVEKIDFEAYKDASTAISGDIEGTAGKITFTGATAAGNSVEVTTDPVTGSKALKLTKGDSDTDSNSLEFNYLLNERITKGDYKISYDVRIAQAGAAYPKLGILHTGNPWEVLNYLQMYSGGGLYGGNFSDWKANYKDWFGTNTAKYNYVLNFDGENNICNVKMDINGIDTSTSYAINDYTSKSFGGIHFTLGKSSVYGNNLGWESGSAVVYIDNIKILEYDPNEILRENFRDYTEGSDAGNDYKPFGISKSDGDSITYETDPVSGSRALKLVKGSGTNQMYAEYKLPVTVNEGRVALRYDVRIASATKYFNYLGKTADKNWGYLFGPELSHTVLQAGAGKNVVNDYHTAVGNDYATYEQIIDFGTKTVQFNVYKDGTRIGHYNATHGCSDLTYVNFIVNTDNNWKANAWDCIYNEDSPVTAENNPDGVVYIDNITVTKYDVTDVNYPPEFVWSDISDHEKYIPVNREFATFNSKYTVISDSITKENITMTENGAAFDGYEVAADGEYAVKVNFTALKPDCEYTITLSGFESIDGMVMTKPYSITFNTVDEVYTAYEESGINADGTKSVITAELHNASEAAVTYQAVAALKKADGALLNVSLGQKGTLNAGAMTDVSVEIAKNTESDKIELYVWDSVNGLKPVTKKKALTAVNERTYGYDNYVDTTKPLKVGFIGGSITAQTDYRDNLMPYLDTMLSADERNVSYYAAGMGGTGTNLGLFRLKDDILSQKPDIVFVEFAVNDAYNDTLSKQQTMEGIIRECMKADHQPMVILLDLTSKDYAACHSSVTAWEPLMEAYGIGYVDVGTYIYNNIASETNPTGKYVWEEADKAAYPDATPITLDATHPNPAGGKAYADYMNEVISANTEGFFKKMTYVEEPVSGREYRNPRLVTWRDAEFDANWKVSDYQPYYFFDEEAEATAAGATLTYTFTGSTIGLYLPKGTEGTTASYSIDDGKYTGSITRYGGHIDMPQPAFIATDLPEGEHTITITVDEATAPSFRFAYFMVD